MNASPRLAAAGEISPQIEREFQRLDVNGDGYISPPAGYKAGND
jgi:hypothetical protein